MLLLSGTNLTLPLLYINKCVLCCDVKEVGSITKLYDHTEQSHASSVFRVVKFQGRGVTGYLECQVGV